MQHRNGDWHSKLSEIDPALADALLPVDEFNEISFAEIVYDQGKNHLAIYPAAKMDLAQSSLFNERVAEAVAGRIDVAIVLPNKIEHES